MIFEEILDGAHFPEGNKNDGNSMDILGQRIGGDQDDWALKNLNIPSVTNEIGSESQFHHEWEVKGRETARKIVLDNTPWLEFVFEKLGAQMTMEPLYYERSGDQLTLAIQVTNVGMSPISSVMQATNLTKEGKLLDPNMK